MRSGPTLMQSGPGVAVEPPPLQPEPLFTTTGSIDPSVARLAPASARNARSSGVVPIFVGLIVLIAIGGGGIWYVLNGASSHPAGHPEPAPQQASSSPEVARRFQQLRVTGVALGDVLNVRASANPKADVVIALPPDAQGLVWKGNTKSYNGFVWYEITVGDRTGWANGKYLTAQ